MYTLGSKEEIFSIESDHNLMELDLNDRRRLLFCDKVIKLVYF